MNSIGDSSSKDADAEPTYDSQSAKIRFPPTNMMEQIALAIDYLVSKGAKTIDIRTPPKYPKVSVYTPDISLTKAEMEELGKLMLGRRRDD